MRQTGFWVVLVGVIALAILIGGLLLTNGEDDEPNALASPPPSATALATTATTPPGGLSPSPSPDSPVSATPNPTVTTPAATGPVGSPGPGIPSLPASDLSPLPAGRERVDAPIDGLEILTLESFPPQYVLQVDAGLSNGCAEPAGHEASRSGSTIQVRVHNSMPQGEVVCTAIYGMYQLNIPLGSDFEPGAKYLIEVNGQSVSFTAQ